MSVIPAVSERYHALDALRAFALLLGVVLHATMSFFLPIPTQDVSQSAPLAVAFHVIHGFRMPLFFLLAGFFAHLLLQRRGVRGFVTDRARRIVVPLVAGWVLLAPLTIAIVAWGVSRSPAAVDAVSSAPAATGFPLIHLWFLYYLCLFYVIALVLRAIVRSIDREGTLRAVVDRGVGSVLRSPFAALLLALPTAAVLYADPAWAVWFGVPTPDVGLMPQWPALVGFGLAFMLGWALQRQPALLDVWRRRWALHLLLAVCLGTYCLVLAGSTPPADVGALRGGDDARIGYALAYTVGTWCWVFGLGGIALRFFDRANAVWRYLADASYFVYLAHLPLVFALQAIVAPWPVHWAVKFPLIVVVTLAVLLGAYHGLVRSSALGELLGGKRATRRRLPATPHIAAVTSMPNAAATAADIGAGNDAPLAPLAQLHGVVKRYGSTLALDHLDFAVRPGELVALLGPNGAGKTTAIGLWLGTLAPDAGDVELLGGSPFDVQRRLGIGAMLQDVTLAPTLSAREHIRLATSCYRAPLSVDDTIAVAGIGAFADTRYGRLSGGQKRQVQFAIAICGNPALLFLDEPTVGLDVQARATMWRAIRALLGHGRAIVLTTHYLEEAEALADRVAVLAGGRLIADGSVADMRALVTRKHVRCASDVDVDTIRRWPNVLDVSRDARLVHVTTSDAEAVVRRLFDADPGLRELHVAQASLADAFSELTRNAA